MPDQDDLLTTAQVAALLAVSARTVTRYVAARRLVPVHFGRTVRYRRADVAQLAGAGVTDWSAADRRGQETVPTGGGASALAVEALRAELAALRADNAALHREVVEQAAAAGLWQGRAHTLEAQLHQLTATAGPPPQERRREATPASPGRAAGPEAPTPALSRWQRFWLAVRG
jgi:excisionase family DNA binding protein